MRPRWQRRCGGRRRCAEGGVRRCGGEGGEGRGRQAGESESVGPAAGGCGRCSCRPHVSSAAAPDPPQTQPPPSLPAPSPPLPSPLQREREGDAARDDRKRGYNSLAGQAEAEVTPEEMEAYRLKKARGDDPLAFINKEKGDKGADGYDYV